MCLVQVLLNVRFEEMISFEFQLKKARKNPETVLVSGFFEPISFSVRNVGCGGTLDMRLTGRLSDVGSAARFAVPCVRLADKPAALHTDRCTRIRLAVSATGSARRIRPNKLRSPDA